MPPSPDLELSLSDKLKQLDDARKSGLISADDYKRLRQDLLNQQSEIP